MFDECLSSVWRHLSSSSKGVHAVRPAVALENMVPISWQVRRYKDEWDDLSATAPASIQMVLGWVALLHVEHWPLTKKQGPESRFGNGIPLRIAVHRVHGNWGERRLGGRSGQGCEGPWRSWQELWVFFCREPFLHKEWVGERRMDIKSMLRNSVFKHELSILGPKPGHLPHVTDRFQPQKLGNHPCSRLLSHSPQPH